MTSSLLSVVPGGRCCSQGTNALAGRERCGAGRGVVLVMKLRSVFRGILPTNVRSQIGTQIMYGVHRSDLR